MKVSFRLNGDPVVVESPPRQSLLHILRDNFQLKSVMGSCLSGRCGSCLVLMDSQAVPSCMIPAFSLRDKQVETVESLPGTLLFSSLEKAFLTHGFIPCPYCAPGKTVLAIALLRQETQLDEGQIRLAIPERWCECSSIELYSQALISAWESRHRLPGAFGG